MIKYIGDLELLETKYGFHKGYQQHNDNYRDYGVMETDNIKIKHNDRRVDVGDDLWISHMDYYHWGYLDKLYEMFKDGVITEVRND